MRHILHCDLNNFFASVECLKRPELKNVPMAVAGDPKKRHGIILAKNELAKKYGIYTPETVYSALKKCPKLVLVESHYDEYYKYSKLVNQIYLKYTDRVEPVSIDESFLDITESINLFGSPEEIAYKIKEEVKNTLGLTISVGVSFNRVLAKMGSDMKKPDAVTVLNKDNFKSKIYPLPIEDLLFVGKSLALSLKKIRINTIGDLAIADFSRIQKKFGKQGVMVYNYANGIDSDYVEYYDTKYEPKSISKGYTFAEDIKEKVKLEKEIKKIADYLSKELRKENLKCKVVCITLKDENLISVSRQKTVSKTDLFQDISKVAIKLLEENYVEGKNIRALTLSVTNLESLNDAKQLNIFDIDNSLVNDNNEVLENVTKELDKLKDRFGSNVINYGSVIEINNVENNKKN